MNVYGDFHNPNEPLTADDIAQITRNARNGSIEASHIANDTADVEWDDEQPWPQFGDDALYGLAGDFVRTVAKHSESDYSALLAQFLCVFGCAIGPSPHFMVEATSHCTRLNVLIIGQTAAARKGTAMDQVKRVFRIADEAWLENALLSGLASG